MGIKLTLDFSIREYFKEENHKYLKTYYFLFNVEEEKWKVLLIGNLCPYSSFWLYHIYLLSFFFKKFILFIFTWGHFFSLLLEREEEREGEKHRCERNIIGCLLYTLTKDRTHNLGLSPGRESNLQPSGLRVITNQMNHIGQGSSHSLC